MTDWVLDYEENGAAVVRGVLSADWIERMRAAIQEVLDNPGDASLEYADDKPGRYYGDFFIWRRNAVFKEFMMNSPLPELAATLMGASEVRFFYDQLLVKEPSTQVETPWHQDLPYWPVCGNDIMSVWVPFDVVSEARGGMQYIKGSHKWGKFYAPGAFKKDSGFGNIYEKAGLEPLPPIDELLDGQEIIGWDMEPGDVLLHHPLTLHHSSGNSSATARRRALALRYLGNDARYDTRSGTFMSNPKIKAILPEINLADGDTISGELFPKVWARSSYSCEKLSIKKSV